MSKRKAIAALVQNLGERFSVRLGIDLSGSASTEIFKWFLASILFGARISESIVINTYREFEKEKILSAKKMSDAGWDRLVKVLDDGGYVRYDFKTATKLLEVMGTLEEQYGGDLNRVHREARDSSDLESRLKNLGKGIGDVTVNVFLRELRGTWEKADPQPAELVVLATKNLKLCQAKKPRNEILNQLKSVWQKSSSEGKTFVDFETALLRLGKDFCRKEKCHECLLRSCCEKVKL